MRCFKCIFENALDLEVNGIHVNKTFIQDENDALYFQGKTILCIIDFLLKLV